MRSRIPSFPVAAALARMTRSARLPGRIVGGGASGAMPFSVDARARALAAVAVFAQRCPEALEALACVMLPLAVGSLLFYRGARQARAKLGLAAR
jgi:hypothetical protein